MIPIWVALIIFFWHWAVAEKTVNIANDMGGNVVRYVIMKNYYNATNTRVKITGTCVSACTIFTGAKRVCVGPNARLGFHLATNPSGTRLMVRQWPKAIRQWALPLSRNLRYLSGAELHSRIRSC